MPIYCCVSHFRGLELFFSERILCHIPCQLFVSVCHHSLVRQHAKGQSYRTTPNALAVASTHTHILRRTRSHTEWLMFSMASPSSLLVPPWPNGRRCVSRLLPHGARDSVPFIQPILLFSLSFLRRLAAKIPPHQGKPGHGESSPISDLSGSCAVWPPSLCARIPPSQAVCSVLTIALVVTFNRWRSNV